MEAAQEEIKLPQKDGNVQGKPGFRCLNSGLGAGTQTNEKLHREISALRHSTARRSRDSTGVQALINRPDEAPHIVPVLSVPLPPDVPIGE